LAEEKRRNETALEAICNIGQAVALEFDQAALLELIYREFSCVIDADAFALGLYNEEAEELRFEFLSDQGERLPIESLAKADGWGLPGRVFEERSALFFEDLGKEEPVATVLPWRETARSWLGVPLLAGDRILGVVIVVRYEERTFDQLDRSLLEMISGQAAVSIEDQLRHIEHERRITQLSVLSEIGQALAAALDLEALLKRVHQEVSRVMDVSNFYIATHNPETDVVSFPLAIEEGESVRWRSRQAGSGLTEHIMRTRTPLLLRGDVAGALQEIGIELIGRPAASWMGVPLLLGDRVVGVMAVQSPEIPDLYDEEDLSLLSTIAAHTAIAIENARLYGEARRQVEEMSTLFLVSRILVTSLEPEETWKAIFQAVHGIAPYEAIEACLYDERRQILRAVMAGTPGHCWPSEEVTYQPGEGFTGQIALMQKPLLVADVHRETEIRPATEQFAGVELRSYLGVPMILGDRLIGTLEISNSKPNLFTEHHLDLLMSVASQAAVAIERAQLFEAMRDQASELAVLNELGRALTARLTVDQVLEETHRQAARLIDTTNFYVALYDEAEDEITFAIDVIEGEIRRPYSTRKAGQGLTEYIIRNREPLLIREDVPAHLAEIGVEQIGGVALSWLGVPLMLGDRVLGVMAVQSYTTPRLYGAHDRDLLISIASQAVAAIENARLFQETQRALEELRESSERQRQLLAVIQELSTPLVPVTEDILVLPLVGTVDSGRAQQMMDALLEGVTSHRASIVIIDITGVPVVDTSVANYLLQATEAVRLLGAESILVGITPEVAQTIVGLGVDLERLVTRSDLQGGIERALRWLGKRIH
jgi:GAF domain-containing protein